VQRRCCMCLKCDGCI